MAVAAVVKVWHPERELSRSEVQVERLSVIVTSSVWTDWNQLQGYALVTKGHIRLYRAEKKSLFMVARMLQAS